jgi:hypothetical protein
MKRRQRSSRTILSFKATIGIELEESLVNHSLSFGVQLSLKNFNGTLENIEYQALP